MRTGWHAEESLYQYYAFFFFDSVEKEKALTNIHQVIHRKLPQDPLHTYKHLLARAHTRMLRRMESNRYSHAMRDSHLCGKLFSNIYQQFQKDSYNPVIPLSELSHVSNQSLQINSAQFQDVCLSIRRHSESWRVSSSHGIGRQQPVSQPVQGKQLSRYTTKLIRHRVHLLCPEFS